MHRNAMMMLVSLAVTVAACGGGQTPDPATPATQQPTASTHEAAPASPSDDGEAQAARGAKLYATACASCHGETGSGGDAPSVVGKNALPLDPPEGAKYRKVQFRTALDVATWVVKNMPPDGKGTLTEADYWDILAFDLKANGVPVAGKRIDATTAGSIVLH